jgi:hypothetical protein
LCGKSWWAICIGVLRFFSRELVREKANSKVKQMNMGFYLFPCLLCDLLIIFNHCKIMGFNSCSITELPNSELELVLNLSFKLESAGKLKKKKK